MIVLDNREWDEEWDCQLRNYHSRQSLDAGKVLQNHHVEARNTVTGQERRDARIDVEKVLQKYHGEARNAETGQEKRDDWA